MVVAAATLRALQTSVASATECLTTWKNDHELQLALPKAECAFLNGRRVLPDFAFTMGEAPIAPAPTVKYLGMIFDTRRTFRPHVETMTERALRTAGSLSRLMINLRGPKLFVRKAYYAVLENIVLYAAPVWADRVQNNRVRVLLRRVQRAGLNRVACAYRMVSSDALSVIARAPPILLKVRERAVLYEETHRLEQPGVTRLASRRPTDPAELVDWKKRKREDAKEATLTAWEAEWRTAPYGRWIHRLLPNLRA